MISYDIHNYELRYVGNSRGLVIETYPSRRKVLLKKNIPYNFVPGDVINSNAIKYYNSMYNLGVRLIYKANSEISKTITIDNSSDEDKKILNEIKSKSEQSSNDNLLDSLSDTEDELPPGVIISTESTDPETSPDTISQDDNTTVNIDEEVISELLEYLDINYDDEKLRALASELGIKFRSNSSKSNIMNKIVNDPTGYSYVYGLVTK